MLCREHDGNSLRSVLFSAPLSFHCHVRNYTTEKGKSFEELCSDRHTGSEHNAPTSCTYTLSYFLTYTYVSVSKHTKALEFVHQHF